MTFKILYIDDESTTPRRDAQAIREKLESPATLEVDLIPPPKKFSDLPTLPDALLVDFDLSTAPPDGESVDYYGSSLASEVRMRHPSCPIALITRVDILTPILEQLIDESADVDIILHKNDVMANADAEREKILTIIEGFKALADVEGKKWDEVLTLMEANEDEALILREAGPPIVKGQWSTPKVARWIRLVVLKFPGILYDDLTAATRLGLDINSFQQAEVQEFFADCRYTGIFCSSDTRWWRGRLFNYAQRLLLKHNRRGPIADHFRDAFQEERGVALKPSLCVVDNTAVADWVCYILRQPVKQQHSLPYYPDNRPSVMDQARVSFKAVKESEEFNEALVDSDSYAIVEKLWEGE